MPLYKKCPHCGSNNDHAEVCECRRQERSPQERIADILREQNPLHDLMTKEKAPTRQ